MNVGAICPTEGIGSSAARTVTKEADSAIAAANTMRIVFFICNLLFHQKTGIQPQSPGSLHQHSNETEREQPEMPATRHIIPKTRLIVIKGLLLDPALVIPSLSFSRILVSLFPAVPDDRNPRLDSSLQQRFAIEQQCPPCFN